MSNRFLSLVFLADDTINGVNSLNERIRTKRNDCGLTQAQLAAKIGLTASMISFWESAKSRPDKLQLQKLESVLGPLGDTEVVGSSKGPLPMPSASEVPGKTAKARIINTALRILDGNLDGVRSGDIVQGVVAENPQESLNTIRTTIGQLDTHCPEKVYKPGRGLLQLLKYREGVAAERPPAELTPVKRLAEELFYEPFSVYLRDELEECTIAIPLGGNIFKDKWGTPDVIGILESHKNDPIEFATEIVSAEIKVDASALITAFGQACSYKLFSHRTYIVVPRSAPKEDIDRLDALCMIFGIGFIVFDASNHTTPRFEIKVRASRHTPDRFFVNKNIKIVEQQLWPR